MSRTAVRLMAQAAHTGRGEGQAVEPGLEEGPGEAIRLRKEAGEKAGRW